MMTVDPSWFEEDFKSEKLCEKVRRVKNNLEHLYQSEFLDNLAKQATYRKNRYAPKTHFQLKVKDVVAIKTPLAKPVNFPLHVE